MTAEDEQAEAVVDGLGGVDVDIDGQKLTKRQVALLLARVQQRGGYAKAHSLKFSKPSRVSRGEQCCDLDGLDVDIFAEPHPGFNPTKKPFATMRVCTHCGGLKEK